MFQASNTFHQIVSDIIISQNIARYNILLYDWHRRIHTNRQLTSPLRQRFDVTSPKVSVTRAFRSPLIYIFAVSRY